MIIVSFSETLLAMSLAKHGAASQAHAALKDSLV